LKPAVDNDPNDNATPLKYVPYPINTEVNWSINGSTSNPNDGSVSPLSGASSTTYTAPASTKGMSSNPVAVSATLYDPQIAQKIILLSNIKVTDKPTVSGRITLSVSLKGSQTYSHGTEETKTEDGSADFVYVLSDVDLQDVGQGDRSADWSDAAYGGTAN